MSLLSDAVWEAPKKLFRFIVDNAAPEVVDSRRALFVASSTCAALAATIVSGGSSKKPLLWAFSWLRPAKFAVTLDRDGSVFAL
jgi:hypothetical protein